MPTLSILDLAFVPEGATPAVALRHTLDLAQHAEQWEYRRFWLAEHHRFFDGSKYVSVNLTQSAKPASACRT